MQYLYYFLLFACICYPLHAQINGPDGNMNGPEQIVTYPPNVSNFGEEELNGLTSTSFIVEARQSSLQWEQIHVFKNYVNRGGPTYSFGGDYAIEESAFAYFDFTGNFVEIRITAVGIQNLDSQTKFRPIAAGITPIINGNQATFTLNGPAKLSFEPNGKRHEGLHLFVGRPETFIPSSNFVTLDWQTPLVRHPNSNNINDVAKFYIPPPGIEYIYIPGEEHFRGSILLRNNHDVKWIGGRGVINLINYQKDYNNGFSETFRATGVLIKDVDHSLTPNQPLTIEGLIINDPQHYGVALYDSKNVKFENLKIFTTTKWGDGIQNVGSHNIHIRDVFFRTSDDAVSIYPFRDQDDYTLGDNVKDILVEDAILYADKAHAIEIGWHGKVSGLTKSVIDNINFNNIDILEQDEGLEEYYGAIGVNCGDNNYCQNITFSNVRVENFTHGSLLNIKVEQAGNGAAVGDGYRIHNVTFNNLNYTGSAFNDKPSIISGLSNCRYISGIHFNNFVVNGNSITSESVYPLGDGGQAGLQIDDGFWIGGPNEPTVYDVTFNHTPNYVQRDGVYKIRNMEDLLTQRYLSRTTESLIKPGTPPVNLGEKVISAQWGGNWIIEHIGDGLHKIKADNGDYLTEVNQGVWDSINNICNDYYTVTKASNTSLDQQWYIELRPSGNYRIVNAGNFNYSLGNSSLTYPNHPNNYYVFSVPWRGVEGHKWSLIPVNSPKSQLAMSKEHSSVELVYNPSNQMLSVQHLEEPVTKVELYDLSGKLLQTYTDNFDNLELSLNATAIYIAMVYTKSVVSVKKIFLD